MLYAAIAITLALLFVLASVIAWLCYVPLVADIFAKTPFLAAEKSLPLTGGESCEFETADGLRLRGTYLKHNASRRMGVICYLHEMTGDRWSARPYISELLQRGFDVLTFDFRNHGASDSTPGYQPMPWITTYDLLDVQAAVEYLFQREDIDPRGIGLMGVSKGATAALCAAATDARVAAVVTDGAFPIDGMQRYYIRRYASLTRVEWIIKRMPDMCLVSFCKWCKFLVGRRHNCTFLNVEMLAQRVRQPVFMILGEKDGYVPREVARRLRGALAGRSKFWLVPGAKHNRSVQAAPDLYQQRVTKFFLRYLAHGRRQVEASSEDAASQPRASVVRSVG